jgi:hypothetical protein
MYYAYVVMKMYTVLATFLLSKLFSYAYWFAYTGPYFSYKFTVDQKYFYRQLLKRDGSLSKINSLGRGGENGEIEIERIHSGSNLLKEEKR